MELKRLEQAFDKMTECHMEMGHEPVFMKAIAKQAVLKDFGYDVLEHVDAELGRMSDDALDRAIQGRPGDVCMSHLCREVLRTAMRSLAIQDGTEPIVLVKRERV